MRGPLRAVAIAADIFNSTKPDEFVDMNALVAIGCGTGNSYGRIINGKSKAAALTATGALYSSRPDFEPLRLKALRHVARLDFLMAEHYRGSWWALAQNREWREPQ